MASVSSLDKKNTVYSLIKSITAIIFPLITFPYSSRILGVESFGKINFASSIVSYFALFASLGIATFAIRECAKVKDDKNELGLLASKFFSINFLATIFSYIILILALLFSAFLRNYFWLIAIYSFSIVFTTLGADWLNMAVGDFKYITLRGLLFNLLSLVLMFVLIHNKNDYITFAIITVTASSGANLLNIFYRRKYCTIKLTTKLDFKRYFPPILLMFSILLVQEVFVNSDITIIGFLLDDGSSGLYSAATRIYRLPSAVTNSLTNVLLPTLAIAFSNRDVKTVKETQKYAVNFLSLIGLPCVAGLVFFSKEIIVFASGTGYSGAADSLMVLGIALLISLLGNLIINLNLIASGRDMVCFVSCFLSACINIALNLFFIPKYGIVAAANTTVFSQIVSVVVGMPFINKKYFSSSIFAASLKPLLCTICLVVWLIIVKNIFTNTNLLIILGVVVGAIIYFALNILLKEEMTIDFCKNLFKRIFKKTLE